MFMEFITAIIKFMDTVDFRKDLSCSLPVFRIKNINIPRSERFPKHEKESLLPSWKV